jgi:hypothetical protein
LDQREIGRSVFIMSLPDQIIYELSRGVARPFARWPDPTVLVFGAGVYTVWDNDGRFIYVGMSGRGITAETVRRNSPLGIYTRLHSHASGRRSGDQFCVYVADRLVLPTLPQDEALSRRLRACDLLGGSIAQVDEENRLRRLSLPARDHSAGDLAVFSIHFELPRR